MTLSECSAEVTMDLLVTLRGFEKVDEENGHHAVPHDELRRELRALQKQADGLVGLLQSVRCAMLRGERQKR